MSQLFHLGDMIKVLAQGKEIKSLQLKLKSREEAESTIVSENITLKDQLDEAKEDLSVLKAARESFEDEKDLAVNGTRVVARWELMREWLSGMTDKWQPLDEFDRYKVVTISEAQLRGLPHHVLMVNRPFQGRVLIRKLYHP
ncbi:hypothetical protein Bca4012_037698 [Brassica carinata]